MKVALESGEVGRAARCCLDIMESLLGDNSNNSSSNQTRVDTSALYCLQRFREDVLDFLPLLRARSDQSLFTVCNCKEGSDSSIRFDFMYSQVLRSYLLLDYMHEHMRVNITLPLAGRVTRTDSISGNKGCLEGLAG
jgi:hypothetical protein